MLFSGCGGSSAASHAPTVPGNTRVTVLGSSTANGKLSEFDLSFNSIVLTSQSGIAVDLLPAFEHAEFIHRNGSPEPLFTVDIPEDTYISATAKIGPERIQCLGSLPNGETANAAVDYGYTPDARVAVKLPEAIKVSGSTMVLRLDLQVAKSASWSPAQCPSATSFSLTPTLELTEVRTGSQSLRGLNGQVTGINRTSNSFSVQALDGEWSDIMPSGNAASWEAPKWAVAVNSSTVFEGVTGLSALAAGMPVALDASLESDGTLLASRVFVPDTNPVNLSIFNGPLSRVENDRAIFSGLATETPDMNSRYISPVPFSYSDTTFQISKQLSNLQQLPFVPRFDLASMVAGQAVSITSHAANDPSGILPAATVTLLPQTINGTVQSISSEGNLQKYVVSMADYDLFPQLANLLLQTTVLTDPNTIIIYADGNTKRLNTQPIAAGSVFRFNGIVFNDAGTLKMDCAAIEDGVPE